MHVNTDQYISIRNNFINERNAYNRKAIVFLILGIIAIALGSSAFYTNKIFKAYEGGVITLVVAVALWFIAAYFLSERNRMQDVLDQFLSENQPEPITYESLSNKCLV